MTAEEKNALADKAIEMMVEYNQDDPDVVTGWNVGDKLKLDEYYTKNYNNGHKYPYDNVANTLQVPRDINSTIVAKFKEMGYFVWEQHTHCTTTYYYVHRRKLCPEDSMRRYL